MKTSELTGAALDWAVEKCEELHHWNQAVAAQCIKNVKGSYHPSSNWAQGGPIIEREGILIRALHKDGHKMNGQWLAMYDRENTGTLVQWVKRTDWPRSYLSGPTPLIAAMRCYVASKLGNQVKIPPELL